MRRSPLHRVLGRWLSAPTQSTCDAFDETMLFTDEQIRFLAERGVIYLTKRRNQQYSAVIAPDFRKAMHLARRRSADETVVGLMGPGFVPHLRDSSSRSLTNESTQAESSAFLANGLRT